MMEHTESLENDVFMFSQTKLKSDTNIPLLYSYIGPRLVFDEQAKPSQAKPTIDGDSSSHSTIE